MSGSRILPWANRSDFMVSFFVRDDSPTKVGGHRSGDGVRHAVEIIAEYAAEPFDFDQLAAVPPEGEWFANLSNPSTRRAYEDAIRDFMRFTGITRPEEFYRVTRAHIIAWRDVLVRRTLGGATIRHRLASLVSLFEHLCEEDAVTHNPVKGVERPRTESGEGKTPALGDHQARKLLDAPAADTIKSKRDRAILTTLLFHPLRRRQDAASAAAPWHQRANQRPSRSRLPRHRRERRADPAGEEQHHREARLRDHVRWRLSAGAELFRAAWVRDRRACAACDRRHQRARPTGRQPQGAGVARPCQHQHHAHQQF